jgi:hypothetical protein
MNLPYDILFNICTFLNYRDLIRYCSINKQYYADCKKKDSFYKKQLTEFEQYACPLFSFEPSELDNVNKFNRLDELNKYLQKINILDKRGIMPYIDNKVVEIDDMPMKRGYGVYDCGVQHNAHILLYTDIITTSENFNDFLISSHITIGNRIFYSTNKCVKLPKTELKVNSMRECYTSPENKKKNIYRLCWNINSMNSSINYDKNALWIPLMQLKYHETRIRVNLINDIDFDFRFTGIYHEPIVDQTRRMNNSHSQSPKYFIRPNLRPSGNKQHFFDKCYDGFCYYSYDNELQDIKAIQRRSLERERWHSDGSTPKEVLGIRTF